MSLTHKFEDRLDFACLPLNMYFESLQFVQSMFCTNLQGQHTSKQNERDTEKNCKAIGLESRAEPRRLRQEVEGGGGELCVCPLTYLRGNYLSRMASLWPLSLFEAT